jgi:hypothetical protein
MVGLKGDGREVRRLFSYFSARHGGHHREL